MNKRGPIVDGNLPDRRDSVGYLANWAARLLAKAMDERLAPFGLTSGQLPVFFALARGEELTQRDLARHAAIEQPTMAATLGRMERDGWVTRRPSPHDGRSSLVILSPQALARVPDVVAAVRDINGRGLAGLNDDEVTALKTTLRTIIGNLDPGADTGPT
jgi:DNA-binding MarR family transcriptional regulator